MLQKMAMTFSDFARMPEPCFETLQLNDEVESVCYLLQNTFEKIAFKTDLNPEIPPIQGDQNQIKRVLNNLLKNAAESVPDRGEVMIRTDYNPDKRQVNLTIQDNGSGMTREVLSQIFKPYFSSKKRGTGLGLVIVQKIVNSHKGSIGIESEPGSGTKVTIRLPVKNHAARGESRINKNSAG